MPIILSTTLNTKKSSTNRMSIYLKEFGLLQVLICATGIVPVFALFPEPRNYTGSNSTLGTLSTIPVGGTNFSISYTITKGTVVDIKTDIQSKSLIIYIQTTGDGILTITLPRALIDSQTNGHDDQFFVLNNGQEANFQEINKTSVDRTLSIPFLDGTEQIEIIGTQVVPEFGPIAALVLAIALVSIIAVSAKTGLRFMPKY